MRIRAPGKHEKEPKSQLSKDNYFLLQEYIVKMRFNSIKLDIKLVIELTENKDSAHVHSIPRRNRTPKHKEVLNIKNSCSFLIPRKVR